MEGELRLENEEEDGEEMKEGEEERKKGDREDEDRTEVADTDRDLFKVKSFHGGFQVQP